MLRPIRWPHITLCLTAILLVSVLAVHGLHPLPAVAAAPAAQPGQDWPVYGGQLAGDHYSPMTQINRGNVSRLRQAWTYDTGDHAILQNSPIMVGRTVYIATASQHIVALDGATGAPQWVFNPAGNSAYALKSGQPIRGVTYWQDGPHGRILAGIVATLYELDAATGKPVDQFADHGHIDLREDLGTDPTRAAVAMTTPGVIYKDLIIVGFRAPEDTPRPPR